MAEYSQMFEQIRDYSHTMTSRENLFVPLSFGILAYTVAYKIDFSDLIIASLVSIGIFLYYMHACERVIYVINLHNIRSGEIEKEINDVLGCECLKYQRGAYKNLYDQKLVAEAKSKKIFDPLRWFRLAGILFESRRVRLMMLVVLIVLWFFRIA